MSRGSAWAASRDRAVASVEEPQQRRLAEWTDGRASASAGFRGRTEWEDKQARRRAEFGARITAIAAQVASEVSVAVASEVSAAVAAALQAARAGHHEYLDLAPTSTSIPTASVADDNASVLDASMVVSAQRSTLASTQQQQQQEDAAQAIENTVDNVLAAWTPTTCSTRCQSRDVIVSVSAPVSAATSASSEVTVGGVTECCCIDLEPAAETSTLTSALDIPGARSAMNSLALPATSGCSAMVHTTCSTRCRSSTVTMLLSATAPAATSASSKVTVDVIPELCCLDLEPSDVLEQITTPPATCSTNCSSNDIDTSSPVSSSTQGTPARLLPKIAQALTPELKIQVWTSPSNLSTNGVHDRKGYVVMEDLFSTTIVPSEVSIVQSLELCMNCVLQKSVPERCLIICFGVHMDMLKPMSRLIVHWNVKKRGQVLRPSPWPSFECIQVWTLWCLEKSPNCTKEQAEEMGNPHLFKDSVLMNSGFKFCQVKLLFQDDYAHEAQPDCHVTHTGFIHDENDFEPACKILARCFPSISDFAWVYRVSFPLPMSVVRLENHTEKLQQYFVFLIALKPWPSCELLLLIVIWESAEFDANHNLVLLQRKIGEGAVNMQFPGPLHEVHVYREPSWNYQCGFGPVQWEIAWFSPLKYFSSDRQIAQPLFAHSVQPCTLGEVSLPELEQVQWRTTRVTQELLFPHMGEEILPANSIVIRYGVVTVPAWYMLGTEFISAAAYFAEFPKVQCIGVCVSPGDVTATLQIWQGHIWVNMVLEFDEFQVTLLGMVSTSSVLEVYADQCIQLQPFIETAPMKHTVLGSPMKNIIVLIDQPLLLSWDSGGCVSTLDDMQDIPCNSANCPYRALVSLHLIEFSCLRMRYPNCKRLISETATQYDFQCVAWEFAWPLHSVCAYPLMNGGCHYLTSDLASIVTFQFIVYGAMRSSRSLVFYQEKLSWDPGIWPLLYFFGFFTQAEVTGRRNVKAPTYYHDHAFYSDNVCVDQPYHLDAFCGQVNISYDYFLEQVGVVCSLNPAKFRLNYGTHRDLGEVMKNQVPWDPGGSTWHRLEVKPDFKEGGMLATNPTLVMGWTIGYAYWAWAAGKQRKTVTTNTSERATNDLARNWTASASSASSMSFSGKTCDFDCGARRTNCEERPVLWKYWWTVSIGQQCLLNLHGLLCHHRRRQNTFSCCSSHIGANHVHSSLMLRSNVPGIYEDQLYI